MKIERLQLFPAEKKRKAAIFDFFWLFALKKIDFQEKTGYI